MMKYFIEIIRCRIFNFHDYKVHDNGRNKYRQCQVCGKSMGWNGESNDWDSNMTFTRNEFLYDFGGTKDKFVIPKDERLFGARILTHYYRPVNGYIDAKSKKDAKNKLNNGKFLKHLTIPPFFIKYDSGKIFSKEVIIIDEYDTFLPIHEKDTLNF